MSSLHLWFLLLYWWVYQFISQQCCIHYFPTYQKSHLVFTSQFPEHCLHSLHQQLGDDLFSSTALGFFGIKAINVALNDLSNTLLWWKFCILNIKSWFKISQHFLMKSIVKPSGPGTLSRSHCLMISSTSSSVNGLCNHLFSSVGTVAHPTKSEEGLQDLVSE